MLIRGREKHTVDNLADKKRRKERVEAERQHHELRIRERERCLGNLQAVVERLVRCLEIPVNPRRDDRGVDLPRVIDKRL